MLARLQLKLCHSLPLLGQIVTLAVRHVPHRLQLRLHTTQRPSQPNGSEPRLAPAAASELGGWNAAADSLPFPPLAGRQGVGAPRCWRRRLPRRRQPQSLAACKRACNVTLRETLSAVGRRQLSRAVIYWGAGGRRVRAPGERAAKASMWRVPLRLAARAARPAGCARSCLVTLGSVRRGRGRLGPAEPGAVRRWRRGGAGAWGASLQRLHALDGICGLGPQRLFLTLHRLQLGLQILPAEFQV